VFLVFLFSYERGHIFVAVRGPFLFAVFISRFFLLIRLNIRFIPLLTRLFNFFFKKTVLIL